MKNKSMAKVVISRLMGKDTQKSPDIHMQGD